MSISFQKRTQTAHHWNMKLDVVKVTTTKIFILFVVILVSIYCSECSCSRSNSNSNRNSNSNNNNNRSHIHYYQQQQQQNIHPGYNHRHHDTKTYRTHNNKKQKKIGSTLLFVTRTTPSCDSTLSHRRRKNVYDCDFGLQKQQQQQQQQQHHSPPSHLLKILNTGGSLTQPRTRIAKTSLSVSIFEDSTTITTTTSSFLSDGIVDWFVRGVVALFTYIGCVAYYDRPRGELLLLPMNDQNKNPLKIQTSNVPNAGSGLFANVLLSKGTVLGTYPGVVLPLPHNIPKLREYPHCETYIWRFSDNKYVIDPTNNVGTLEDVCYGGNPSLFGSRFVMQTILGTWFTVPTTLCRINEPPLGCDVNVITIENCENRTVSFVLERDVQAGEEFYIDYGLTYDRSRYGGGM